MEMQRPPALITPDESDEARTAGPISATSDLFSPGQLMTTLLSSLVAGEWTKGDIQTNPSTFGWLWGPKRRTWMNRSEPWTS